MKGPVVYKFGGTSLGDAARIAGAAELVAEESARAGGPPVVVVSAVGGMTDRLVKILSTPADGRRDLLGAVFHAHRQLLTELSGKDAAGPGLLAPVEERAHQALEDLTDPILATQAADVLLAVGEDLSALILVAALQARGTDAAHVDARKVIRTDAIFGLAQPAEAAIRSLVDAEVRPVVAAGQVAVLQGFVGGTADGRTTTLGRGGSDFTATLLGAALDAREVHIWTDVEGVLSGDPRYVDRPRVLPELGFEETVELAWFGAKVIHPGAAKHAVARGVPVRIRSTFAPERPGTLILEDRLGDPDVAAVACKRGVALIKVRGRPSALPYGFLARVFEILARHRLPVDLVATSHSSTAFTVDDQEDVGAVARELEEVAEVEVRPGLATVTVVGNGLLREPGFDARVFGIVGTTPIHLVSQASDVSLSFVVDEGDADGLVRRLHGELVAG